MFVNIFSVLLLELEKSHVQSTHVTINTLSR